MNIDSQFLPQARITDIVTRELPNEMLVYDLTDHQAHCLNQTAALVWKNCDGTRNTAQLAMQIGSKLKADVSPEIIWAALAQLSQSNLLVKKLPAAERPLSRRQIMQRIGWTTIAVPLVTSIIAPSALAGVTCAENAPSCKNNGTGSASECVTSTDCCSCCCVQTNPSQQRCQPRSNPSACIFV